MPVNAILLAAGAFCAAVRSFLPQFMFVRLPPDFLRFFGIRFFTLQS